MNRLKKLWHTKVIPILFALAGMSLMLYPWISNWLYENNTNSKVKTYEAESSGISDEEKEAMFAAARAYNETVQAAKVTITDPFVETLDDETDDLDYYEIMSFDDAGLICFVEVPKINVYLPVYHGTDSATLERGAGHIQGTAFPVGDVGDRPIISAHTGINSAKMFSDLTELEIGDQFYIHVMDEIFAYEVCNIDVILPEETEKLVADPDRDLVSLLTCTPYGINSHRLVVTGERIEYSEEAAKAAADDAITNSTWKRAYRNALISGAFIIASIAVVTRVYYTRQKRKQMRFGDVRKIKGKWKR